MSLATLKRKIHHKYKVVSASRANFSINGALRSSGYIGQTSLSQYTSRTLMKGNVIKGYGGCCGEYIVAPLVKANVTSLNNPAVIKPSVLNTYGMIHTKYRWILRPEPFSSTKPYVHNITEAKSQSTYIDNLVNKSIANATTNQIYNQLKTTTLDCIPFICTITKPGINTISQSERLILLTQQCTPCTDESANPAPTHKTPFSC